MIMETEKFPVLQFQSQSKGRRGPIHVSSQRPSGRDNEVSLDQSLFLYFSL